jgi:hypothetical protein
LTIKVSDLGIATVSEVNEYTLAPDSEREGITLWEPEREGFGIFPYSRSYVARLVKRKTWVTRLTSIWMTNLDDL